MSNHIYIVGFPKSGNTWLSRLMGEVLDSPVGGMHNAMPLATEGQERQGNHKVIQLHLRPTVKDLGEAVPSSYDFSVPRYDGSVILHVVRDPRDVVVSCMYYWGIKSLDEALKCVGESIWPLSTHGPWSAFIQEWLDLGTMATTVRYEDILADTKTVVLSILKLWNLEAQVDIDEAIRVQSFAHKKRQIQTEEGVWRPYGSGIQLRNLRKGIVGDWENHFNEEQEIRAREYFGEAAARLGYEL